MICEQGDYDPKYETGLSPPDKRGDQDFKKKTSREKLPLGRPQEYQLNVVEPRPDNGGSINA